jgi:hypothetical protein
MVKNEAPIRIIGIYFLLCAVYGIFKLAYVIPAFLSAQGAGLLHAAIPFSVFIISALSGYRLLLLKPGAVKLGKIIFAMQMISFIFPGISYYFSLGFRLFIEIGSYGAGLRSETGTGMFLWLGERTDYFSLNINLVAIAGFLLLQRWDRPENDTAEVKPEDVVPSVKPPTASRPRQTPL